MRTDRELEDREHERSLRAVDPRSLLAPYRPRMVMLSDEPPTLAEQGTLLDHFIDPDDP